MQWETLTDSCGQPYLYTQHHTNWDGDAFGNEWRCGYSVRTPNRGHPALFDTSPFEVYEDDGHGNGNYLAGFRDFWAAARYIAAR